ncbi:hypothetical protein D3C84_1191230 [compost metagenome]
MRLVELICQRLALAGWGAEQAIGPVLIVALRFVTVGAEAVLTWCAGLVLGGRLDFTLFQSCQFLIQVELVEVQFSSAPGVLPD